MESTSQSRKAVVWSWFVAGALVGSALATIVVEHRLRGAAEPYRYLKMDGLPVRVNKATGVTEILTVHPRSPDSPERFAWQKAGDPALQTKAAANGGQAGETLQDAGSPAPQQGTLGIR
jgi:hypothetical protein